MSSPESSFGKDLLLSLPPVEPHEFDASFDYLHTTLELVEDDARTAHQKRTCQTITSQDSSTSSSTKRSNTQIEHIEAKLTAYQQRYKDKGVDASFTVEAVAAEGTDTTDTNGNDILIHTHAQLLDAPNCASGMWQGRWRIGIVSETSATVAGTVTVHAAFAEGGSNVQTMMAREIAQRDVSTQEEKVNAMVAHLEQSKLSYEEQLATAVVTEEMAKCEEALFQSLTTMFDSSLELRTIRRVLPITKTRFKWDSAAQRNVKLLNARTSTTSN